MFNPFNKQTQVLDEARVNCLVEELRRVQLRVSDPSLNKQQCAEIVQAFEQWRVSNFSDAESTAAERIFNHLPEPESIPATTVQEPTQPPQPVAPATPTNGVKLTHPSAIAVMDVLINKLHKPVKVLWEHRGHRAIDIAVVPTGRKSNGAIVPIKDLVNTETTDALKVHAGHEPSIVTDLGHVLISVNLPESEWKPVLFRPKVRWLEYEDQYDRFPIQFGVNNRNEPIEVYFGESDQSHAFILGGSGSGKTSLIHTVLINGTMRYSPKNFQFTVIDPQGTSHQPFFPSRWAWREMDVANTPQKTHATFDAIEDEISHRKLAFSKAMDATGDFIENVSDYRQYCLRRGLEWFPRIFVLIDEKHELATEFNPFIERVLNGYRKFGFHVLIGSHRAQTEHGLTATMKTSLPVKIALKTDNADDSRVAMGDDRAYKLSKKGDFWAKVRGETQRGLGLLCPREMKSAIVNSDTYRPEVKPEAESETPNVPAFSLNGLDLEGQDLW